MTESVDLPPAGWYADPEEPERFLRWWDGYAWQLRKLRADAPGEPLGKGFDRLGWFTRLGVRLVAMVSVVQLVLYFWGYSMIEDAIANGDLGKLDLYDDLDIAILVVLLVVLVPTGICWMVWQYKLAGSAPRDRLVRAPGWHAWGYVVPIVAIWFPYGNMRDLVRWRLPDSTLTVVGWWWGLFLASTVLDRISAGFVDTIETPADFQGMLSLSIASSLTTLLAAPLALKLNRELSEAGREQDLTRGATPAG